MGDTVSVVIPHLRGADRLLGVLGDLERWARPATGQSETDVSGMDSPRDSSIRLEVMLVDNASVDGSIQQAAAAYPWVKVLRLDRNEGYAGGCNRGIEATTGDWVWLMNDDVRLAPDSLERMLEVIRSADDVAAVQPKIRSMQHPTRFDYAGGAGGMIDRFGYPYALGRLGGWLEEDRGQYDTVREIFWASGTACLWRRTTLDEIGLLDERYFAHMEEIDLAWRSWNRGWRILSAPQAVVHHFGGGTLAYVSWRKMYLNHRNSLITLAKNRDSGKVLPLLLARFILDHGIAVAEFVSGRPGRLTAIWAGWISFLAATRFWMTQRQTLQKLRSRRDRDLRHVVYSGCIMFEYLRGVRSAGALAKG